MTISAPFLACQPNLLQKPLRDVWSPDGKIFRRRWQKGYRGFVVNQIAISVMLYHITCRVPPIVEDLGAQHMSAHPPYGCISFLRQPLMPQHLRVKVMYLKRTMVHMLFPMHGHKKGMMVDEFFTTVNVGEDAYECPLTTFRVVEEVGGNKVEITGVEIELILKILDCQSVVTQLQTELAFVNDRCCTEPGLTL